MGIMKNIITLVFLISSFLSLTTKSESQPIQEWIQRYNGPGNGFDEAKSIVVDRNGNVFITGESTGNGTYLDYATIKYSTAGVQLWLSRYNGTAQGNDYATDIAIDSSGSTGVFVTGYSWGNGTDFDFATIKYNPVGGQIWVQRYDGPNHLDDKPFAIAVDHITYDIIVAGQTRYNATGFDMKIIRYNLYGNVRWSYENPTQTNGDDIWYDVVLNTVNGNVFTTGTSFFNATNNDCMVMKLNALTGGGGWYNYYNYSNRDDRGFAVAVDNTGTDVFVTGASFYDGGSDYDYITIKYTNGIQQWVKRYNGTGNGIDQASSIAIDNSGNVYVTGFSRGNGTDFDYATIKYNSDGIQLWVARYNSPANGYDRATKLKLDASGNVYVTGYSVGNGTSTDYATIKYNSAGVQQWVMRYNGTGNSEDYALDLAVDNLNNVYVTGSSIGNNSDRDYATIKYSQQIGIQPISTEVPDYFSLSQNYPNPFNPVTKIRFSIPILKGVSAKGEQGVLLKVYDILGREVATLVNEQLKPGIYEVDWDASVYSGGVYYYKLETESYSETKKMVLVK